jgi:hypothetical protein
MNLLQTISKGFKGLGDRAQDTVTAEPDAPLGTLVTEKPDAKNPFVPVNLMKSYDFGGEPAKPDRASEYETFGKKQLAELTGATGASTSPKNTISAATRYAYGLARLNNVELPLTMSDDPEMAALNEFIVSHREGRKAIRSRQIARPESLMAERMKLFPELAKQMPTYEAPGIADAPEGLPAFAIGRLLGSLLSGNSLGEAVETTVPQFQNTLQREVGDPMAKRQAMMFEIAKMAADAQLQSLDREENVSQQLWQKQIADQMSDEAKFEQMGLAGLTRMDSGWQKAEELASKEKIARDKAASFDQAISRYGRIYDNPQMDAQQRRSGWMSAANQNAELATQYQFTDPDRYNYHMAIARYAQQQAGSVQVNTQQQGRTISQGLKTAQEAAVRAGIPLIDQKVLVEKAREALLRSIPGDKRNELAQRMALAYDSLGALTAYRNGSLDEKREARKELVKYRNSYLGLSKQKFDFSKVLGAAQIAFAQQLLGSVGVGGATPEQKAAINKIAEAFVRDLEAGTSGDMGAALEAAAGDEDPKE